MPQFGGSNLANFLLSGLSFLFGIIILGMSGYLTHEGNTLPEGNNGWPVGTARYMLFAAIWTLVFTLALPLITLSSAKVLHLASAAIAGLTVLFLFAGWVALAAQAHGFAVRHFTDSVVPGVPNPSVSVDQNPYRVAAADAVFAAVENVIWVGIAVMSAIGGSKRP